MAQANYLNLIINRMPAADFERIGAALEAVDLTEGVNLITPRGDIEFAYFLECGQASVIGVPRGREEIELGIIGFEGATGLPVTSVMERSPFKTMMQSGGHGCRIRTDVLRAVIAESPSLRQHLGLFTRYLYVLAAYTAISHGAYSLTERLARWLLMAHDRSSGDDLHFVHEYLSHMLCVRRSGVRVATHVLEGMGYIRSSRATIKIRDREGLKRIANGSYGAPEAEYAHLFGIGFTRDAAPDGHHDERV